MDKILELLEGTPNGVYAVDLDQRVILWNHEAERTLGWNAEEALGTYCFDLIGGARLSSQDSEEPVRRRDCPVIRLARNAAVAPLPRVREFYICDGVDTAEKDQVKEPNSLDPSKSDEGREHPRLGCNRACRDPDAFFRGEPPRANDS